MNLYLPRTFALLAVLGPAVASVQAQQTIVFSKPSDVSADKANNFMDNPSHRVNADSYKAPQSIFNYMPEVPMPPVFIYQNQDPAVLDALNKRKNWTLLTPEQILGLQTPEQVLGLTDPKGESKLSLEDQFLLRQSRISATNSRSLAAVWKNDDKNPFYKKREDEKRSWGATDNRPDEYDNNGRFLNGTARQLDPFGKRPANNPFSAGDRQEDSPWASAFTQPTAPKPSLEQIASMERFRALMEPVTTPENTPATTHWNKPATPDADSFFEPVRKVNPIGASVLSLEDSSGHATGIKPLPGIATPPPTPPKTRPAWQAELPPWLSDKPQPHNMNQF